MKIAVNLEEYVYEVRTFLEVFFPEDKLEFVSSFEEQTDMEIEIGDDLLRVSFYEFGKLKYENIITKDMDLGVFIPSDKIEKRKVFKRLLKKLIYKTGFQITKKEQPWGILTGIRPTKVVFKLLEEYGDDLDSVVEILKKDYLIAEEKIELMLEVVQKERRLILQDEREKTNIYLGIPFCPTKCFYCSFTSFPIGSWKGRVWEYLEALQKEISFVSNHILQKSSKQIRSFYIGGGTPTSLNEKDLEALLIMIHKNFPMDRIEEFTIEAGRPDTINPEKLKLLKEYGVQRISINPQTMNQKTLDLIGRGHSAEDVEKTYEVAEHIGFKVINMDLIVGLPGETTEDIVYTMKKIKEMAPTNLTVHTLALKRGSKLVESEELFRQERAETIEEMLKITDQGARCIGLKPYYLYRQKHMVGNFENVGYAREGLECIYNMEMIEEKSEILALGAGGISKVISKSDGKISRIENMKDVNAYIKRIDEVINRKKQSKDEEDSK